jgi:hypothetical protein
MNAVVVMRGGVWVREPPSLPRPTTLFIFGVFFSPHRSSFWLMMPELLLCLRLLT